MSSPQPSYLPKSFIICTLLGLTLLLPLPASSAEEFSKAMSLQGFTGLLNVPNAEVTDEGKAVLFYSDQEESGLRDSLTREDSYIFSVGLLPNFELGGRLTDAPPNMRDLAANFKIKVPFIPKDSLIPQLAVGIQDVGGGANNLQTKYLVASQAWWRLRGSLGYGTGPDRMDGVFGGLEFMARDWLYLLAENDTAETNVGLRVVTSELFGWPVNLQATAKYSLDDPTKTMEYGLGLQFPLGFEHQNRQDLATKAGTGDREKSVIKQSDSASLASLDKPAPPPNIVEPAAPPVPVEIKAKIALGATQSNTVLAPLDGAEAPTPVALEVQAAKKDLNLSRASLRTLRDKLVAAGFQNVRVGMDQEGVHALVEYENTRYNHNELDGLGVVIGTTVDTISPEFKVLQVIMKIKGLQMMQLKAPLAYFSSFLHDSDKDYQLMDALEITTNVAVPDAVSFIDDKANPSWLTSELILWPGVSSLVAWDEGNFDYLLSLKPDYYLNLWAGSVVNARWDIPLDWSEAYDTGHTYGDRRKSSQFERLMLFQTFKVSPSVMINLGGGYVLPDTYGTLNELMWTPGKGNHRFTLNQVFLANPDNGPSDEEKSVYLESYRYYLSPLDLYLVETAGRFMDQDRGYRVELKRFFGDTAFTVYFKSSTTESNEDVQMGGVELSIPLTPRQDMKPHIVQVKGNNNWGYSQETKIVTPGEANYLNTSIGVNPKPPYTMERVFYNRDRLSEEYILKHLLRLRDAYLTYK